MQGLGAEALHQALASSLACFAAADRELAAAQADVDRGCAAAREQAKLVLQRRSDALAKLVHARCGPGELLAVPRRPSTSAAQLGLATFGLATLGLGAAAMRKSRHEASAEPLLA